jgi:hypothetical protein
MALKMAKLVPVLVATVIAVGAVFGAAMPEGARSTAGLAPPITSQTQLDALEKVAEQACRCARNRGGGASGSCWQEYRERTAGRIVSSWASACAPVSTEVDCFAIGGKESCIVTNRNNGELCSAVEAGAAAAAFNQASEAAARRFPRDRRKADIAANAAYERALAQIRRGQVPKVSRPSGGCD